MLPLGIIVTALSACSGGSGDPCPRDEPRPSPPRPAWPRRPPSADMIVIMRAIRCPAFRAGRDTRRARAIAAAHAPILAELQAAKGLQGAELRAS